MRIQAAYTPSPASLTPAAASQPPAQAADDYLTRLVKLVPAEVIALYLSFKSTMDDAEHLPLWGLICVILVVLVRTVGTKQKGKPVQVTAVIVAVISFVLWVYGMGQEVMLLATGLTWLSGPFSSVSIGVWTFIVPYFYKGD